MHLFQKQRNKLRSTHQQTGQQKTNKQNNNKNHPTINCGARTDYSEQ